jgi:hypothetical protein
MERRPGFCLSFKIEAMLTRLTEQDFYQILEVDYSASSDEIQTAYETARDIYSSDSMVSSCILTPEERRHTLRRINEAYNTLIAEDSRRLYDETIMGTPSVESQGAGLESEENAPVENVKEKEPTESQNFPRLVKGAKSAKRRSKLQLGLKEEASGEFIRRARESAGLDLRTIAEETKIGVTMLSYIEEERLDRLPAPVYLKSFVSQYANCLGLDREKVARSYSNRIRRLNEDK